MSKKLDELTDSEIQFYLDGELHGSRKHDLEERIALQPEIRDRILEYKQLDRKFTQSMGQSLFLDKGQPASTPFINLSNWPVPTAFAAGLALAFVINYSPTNNLSASAFAEEAMAAHFQFSPEKHISYADKTVSLENAQSQRDFALPDLSEAGLEVVGVRYFHSDTGRNAQLMYHDPAGRRYTVLITQNPDTPAPEKPAYMKTDLGQVSFWRTGDLNLAVTAGQGELDVRELQQNVAASF